VLVVALALDAVARRVVRRRPMVPV
jgi:hypothetical protein